MPSPLEPPRPSIAGPAPSDDVVFHGRAATSPGGGLVTIETPDGRSVGVLAHIVRHSPSGFAWGYRGSGPADLARSLLAAVLGEGAICTSCAGTTEVVYDFERDVVEPYDPDGHDAELVERCGCDDGLAIPPGLYQRFKEDVVARWPQRDEWRVTAGEIRAWLAHHGSGC